MLVTLKGKNYKPGKIKLIFVIVYLVYMNLIAFTKYIPCSAASTCVYPRVSCVNHIEVSSFIPPCHWLPSLLSWFSWYPPPPPPPGRATTPKHRQQTLCIKLDTSPSDSLSAYTSWSYDWLRSRAMLFWTVVVLSTDVNVQNSYPLVLPC